MNNLELRAIRQGLGLTVADVAELACVTKRSFQYWEAGKVPVPSDVAVLVSMMASQYNLLFDLLLSDVEQATNNNPRTPMRISPTLPFFHSFESFRMSTECGSVAHWRIYQSVVSQLILTGKIIRLSDDAEIPSDWGFWQWLNAHPPWLCDCEII